MTKIFKHCVSYLKKSRIVASLILITLYLCANVKQTLNLIRCFWEKVPAYVSEWEFVHLKHFRSLVETYEKCPEIIYQNFGFRNETLLHKAALNRRIEMVDFLLCHGAQQTEDKSYSQEKFRNLKVDWKIDF